MDKSKLPKVNYHLPVMLMRQGSYFIAYTPALDMSVQAKSKAEVQQRFGEAVQLLFEELHEMGTMDEVLEELGWVKQQAQACMPPQLVTDSPQELEVSVPAYA